MPGNPVSEFRLEGNSDARAVPKRVALIRREDPARLLEDRDELLTTAPHLLLREVIVVQLCVTGLAVASLLFDAPLEGIADPTDTPNPAKAPWYFLASRSCFTISRPSWRGSSCRRWPSSGLS